MASTVDVGNLRAELSLQTQQFTAALNQMGRRLNRFGTSGQRSVDKVGRSFGGMKGAILGVVAALGLIRGFRALTDLTKAAIATESAFDSYRVRLKSLLGDQKEVNLAIEGFVQQAKSTPFAVQEVIGAATTLGSVALGNREKLESLTIQAENIAALTGIPLQAAAVNLQRTLATGIGAADLFRERGVKGLIESIESIPDLSKRPLKEQEELLAKVFGKDGVQGKVAEELSKTLGGSLRNVGDSIDIFKQKLGDAFSPAVIGVARGAIIPFFDRLADLVFENRDLILDFALNAIDNLLIGLSNVLRIGADVLRFFDTLLNLFGGSGAVLGRFRAAFDLLVIGLKSGFLGAIEGIQRGIKFVVDSIIFLLKKLPERFQPSGLLAGLQGASDDLAADIILTANAADNAADGMTDAFARLNQPDALPGAVSNVEKLAGFLEKSADFTDRLRAGVTTEAADAVERRRAAEAGEGDVTEFKGEKADPRIAAFSTFIESLAEGVTSTLSSAVIGAFKGDSIDAAKLFGDLSGKFLEFGFARATETFQNAFEDTITDLTKKLGLEMGEEISAALGLAVGIGLSLIAGAIGGTKKGSESFADVRDSVTSSQEIRGLIVGPTNIAIAQVSTSIADAFVPINETLLEGNAISLQILAATRAGGHGAGALAAVDAGADAASLSSTSLG